MAAQGDKRSHRACESRRKLLFSVVCMICAPHLVAAQLPIRMGVERVEIGQATGSPFGRVSGLALDSQGSVFVVDELSSQVHLISTEGHTVRTFARSGDGPGELRRPCCPRSMPGGRLWVLSPSVNRVEAFRVADSSAEGVGRTVIRGTYSYLLMRPPVIAQDGSVLVMAIQRGSTFLANRFVVVAVDSTGKVTAEHLLPDYPQDFAGAVVASFPNGRTMTRPIPFGAEYWLVQSSDGSYAAVLTSEYVVVHYELNGTPRRRITRDIDGAPLSAAERATGESELADLRQVVERGGGSLPRVSLPAVKPVIDQVWFDQEDRLWVELSARTAADEAQADVYSRNGELVFQARWPSDIDLSLGAIRRNAGWGLRTSALGEHSVVHLVFQE